MNKLSAKNKIITLVAGWLLLCAAMLMYFFGLLDASNQKTLEGLNKVKTDLAAVRAQSESYKQEQADLQLLSQKAIQPDDFFSKDITLVNEIKTLESLSSEMSVKMSLSGVSGTVNTAAPAVTATPMVVVPFSLNLNGNFSDVIAFIETLEHESFISNVTGFSISAAGPGQVTANLGGSFYIKK